MSPASPYIRWLDEIGLAELPEVGGKNASLGELTRAPVPRGVRVPTMALPWAIDRLGADPAFGSGPLAT